MSVADCGAPLACSSLDLNLRADFWCELSPAFSLWTCPVITDLILTLTCRFTFWLDLVTTLLLYALDSQLDLPYSFAHVLWDSPWPMRTLPCWLRDLWLLQAQLPLGSCPTLAAA